MPVPPEGKNWDAPSFHELFHGLTGAGQHGERFPLQGAENMERIWKSQLLMEGWRVSLGRSIQEIVELRNGLGWRGF